MEGKFLLIGKEWIGSFVRYEQRSICFSKLFSNYDPNYTDQSGINNDECEYFGNGISSNEKIYFQNYVFDSVFEIVLDFDTIELEITQQRTGGKTHVTSNPHFAFHDDVFPAFAKNAASQRKFPRPSFYYKTIIPDNEFSSLEEISHISTIKMELNGTEKFDLSINFEEGGPEDEKILEAKFADETVLFSFGISEKSFLWIKSDSFHQRRIFGSRLSEKTELGLYLHSSHSSNSSYLEIFQEKLN